MSYVHESLIDVRAALAEPTDDDLAILSRSDYAGGATDGLSVREMLLAHDQYDRTFERFPPAYLARFAETLPGKSVLAGHDTGRLPMARFFRADVEQRRESGFPTLRQPGKDYPADPGVKAAELVPGFEPRNRTVRWLKGGFYYPADPDLDAKITTGIYRSVSIGFRFADLDCDVCRKSYLRGDCPHLLGQELDDGRRVTGTYSGDVAQVEALEGSIVWLGAQPQARIIKAADGRLIDTPENLAKTLTGEVDALRLKWYQKMACDTGCPRKIFTGPGAPITLPPGPEPGTTDMEASAMTAEQLAALETEVAALRKQVAELEPLAALGASAVKTAQTRYLAAAARAGRSDVEAVAVADMYGAQRKSDDLLKLADALDAEVAARTPITPSADVKSALVNSDHPTARSADEILASAGL